MKTSVHCAIQTLLDNGIHSLPLSSNDIEGMIKRQGFNLVAFDFPLKDRAIKDFTSLDLLSTAEKYPAFTYIGKGNKIVFHRSTLSMQERNRMFAHELGHICLRHFSLPGIRCSSGLKTPQESEAEEFAIELLAPICILRRFHNLTPERISYITSISRADSRYVFSKLKSHDVNIELELKLCAVFDLFDSNITKKRQTTKKNIIFAFVALLAFIILFAVDNGTLTAPDSITMPSPPPIATNISENNSDIVVFTKYGEKYHKRDCWHIKNSDVFETTVSKATEQGYEPCKDCF